VRPQCPPPSAATCWHNAFYKIISGEFTFKLCKLLSGPKVVLREGWIEEYKQWTICWDTLGKLNAIADQVRLQAVHSDDYWQMQDLIFQENKTPLAPPPIPPPFLLFVVIPVSSWLLESNELTGITTPNSNGRGVGGAAKGVLFSWKIRSEGRLLFFHSYFHSLLKKTHEFFLLIESRSTQRHLFLRSLWGDEMAN